MPADLTPGRDRPAPRRWQFTVKSHRALRVRVYARDGFTCSICRWHPHTIPFGYDGRYSIRCTGSRPDGSRSFQDLHLDHIVPRCAGGSNEETNLRTLCDSCNSRKATADKGLKA